MDDVDEPVATYCPSCSCTLGSEWTRWTVAIGHAQQHARITGHAVQLVDARTWTALETIPGEPSLPLWD